MIKEEIQIAEKDMQLLTEEYMRECENVELGERENNEINLKFDCACQ